MLIFAERTFYKLKLSIYRGYLDKQIMNVIDVK